MSAVASRALRVGFPGFACQKCFKFVFMCPVSIMALPASLYGQLRFFGGELRMSTNDSAEPTAFVDPMCARGPALANRKGI